MDDALQTDFQLSLYNLSGANDSRTRSVWLLQPRFILR